MEDSDEEFEISEDCRSLIYNLKEYANNRDLSDIVLRVGDKEFYAHKFVLSIQSDVFRTLIEHFEREKQASGGDASLLEVKESEECLRVFDTFLHFLYSGTLHLSLRTAVGVLCLADKYNVPAMKQLAVEYMEKHARSPNFLNALAWYSWAKLLNLERLKGICYKTMCWNFEKVMALPDWLNLGRDFLEDMLDSSELLIADEFELYVAVRRWLMEPARAEQLEENVMKLLPFIRFPMMAVDQLFRIEQNNDFQGSAHSAELINSMLALAYRFRALCPARKELDVSFAASRYMPRDYKSLTVDNLRMGNTLRFGFQVDVRMYIGAVPSSNRNGEWKLTYRKNGDTWNIHVYCHESALQHNEAHFQLTVVIYGDEEQVMHVERAKPHTCRRGARQQFSFDLGTHTEDSKMLVVLLKPLPNLPEHEDEDYVMS